MQRNLAYCELCGRECLSNHKSVVRRITRTHGLKLWDKRQSYAIQDKWRGGRRMSNIGDLKFDDRNFNKHTARGMALLEKSLQQYGAGRSILLDKDNNIIAGNGIIEAAGNIGLEDLQIVESDGTKIVAVKRTDIELNSKQGREMALADNATSKSNLQWDKETIEEESEDWGINLGEWDLDFNYESHDYFGDERERTYKSTNLDLYDAKQAQNKYGFPELKGSYTIPTSIIGFNEAKTATNFDNGVHFFIDDYQFERVWNSPKKYIDLLKKFKCVFTPDFSLYADMPLAMKIWNIYRSRLVGQILEDNGVDVIPTLSWAGDDTLEFAFDGLPEGGVFAVSTVGVMKDEDAKKIWAKGMEEAIKAVKPDTILLYGSPINLNWGKIKVVNFKAGGFHGV